MSRRVPPPLTPEMSEYLGMDEREIHELRWRSQSRDGVAHTTTGTDAEAGHCTCEAFRWSLVGDGPVGCKHTRCWSDALAHHLGTPPADPGGASAFRPCWHCRTRPYCAEHGCRYDFAASAAQPGGGGGPTPPAPGAARKPLDECLLDLYGPE